MTEQEKRKPGGGKLTRTETVTVRLDPKLRYLADLAARKHRRTLSSYIEWAIEDSLKNTVLDPVAEASVAHEAATLWDVDEADRFVKLALRYPELMTHEEQVRWKLIRECGLLWRGSFTGRDDTWRWDLEEEDLLFDRLRLYWPKFCAVAEGVAEHSTLPDWHRTRPRPPAPPVHAPPPAAVPVPPKTSTGFDDMDDDIPF